MTVKMDVVMDCQEVTLPIFKKGKIRTVYDFGQYLLIVAFDRVSAFDFVLLDGVPHKGRVLTSLSKFWFDYLQEVTPHHCISVDFNDFPDEVKPYQSFLEGRSMLVKKTELIEIECVVRGYLMGTGWKEYQESGTVCGIALPDGLKLAGQLPEPIFTPAYKATDGHDENITIQRMEDLVGADVTTYLKNKSIELYTKGRDFADKKNIILADTKFEFGRLGNDILLIDEVLTPDSSRFWPKLSYKAGVSPPSFDKQIVRDYLASSGWDKTPPIPHLPEEIIQKTSHKYQELESLLLQ